MREQELPSKEYIQGLIAAGKIKVAAAMPQSWYASGAYLRAAPKEPSPGQVEQKGGKSARDGASREARTRKKLKG